MPRKYAPLLTAGASLLALCLAGAAAAQSVGDGGGLPANAPNFGVPAGQAGYGDPSPARDSDGANRSNRGGNDDQNEDGGERRRVVDVTPYIEVGQVVSAELSNGNDAVTYSTVAVGVDGVVATRRVALAASLRYERRIGWDDVIGDNDVISGLVRGRVDAAPGFALEAGALATRASLDGRGGSPDFAVGDRSNVANLYSIYAGPTFGRRLGAFDVGAAYRFGYSRSDVEFAPVLTPGAQPLGSFDESTNHAAIASIGMRPGRLPLGWKLSGGWDRDDSGQLDQRYQGLFGRLDLTLPVSPTLALVGGVGYEDIEVSYRPPLTNGAGQPVVDANGRFVTNNAAPRTIAFETDGLIYDAGVMWRPSRRLSAEARVGRRYGDMTYTGSLSYVASQNTGYQIGLYDGISTIGRSLSAGLSALPTDFTVFRNGVDGALGGCAFGNGGGSCLGPTTNNLSGFAYRNRGIMASMSSRGRGWTVGVAVGYDRRNYVANGLGALPTIDGQVDESYYAYVAASRALDDRTTFGFNSYATAFDSGTGLDALSYGAGLDLGHSFAPRLQGNAALSVNAIDQDGFNTRVFASALLGLRYSF